MIIILIIISFSSKFVIWIVYCYGCDFCRWVMGISYLINKFVCFYFLNLYKGGKDNKVKYFFDVFYFIFFFNGYYNNILLIF